jgi:malate dehydrogenase (oxaloacetate-decarboxylating)(NADP+)
MNYSWQLRGRSQVWFDRTISTRDSLYPPLRRIRQLSLAIAASVATKAYEMNLAREKRPKNLRRHIKAMMYEP